MTAKILAVDDTPQNLRLLEALLSTEGYEVLTAKSGDEALRLVAERHPDLLLVDILMPGMDGYELCRRIRASEATRILPIVLMTASMDQDKARALESGADDFVQKPVLQHELSVRVRSLLRIKRYHDDLASALDRQTAIGDVLRVIGSAAFDLGLVLEEVAKHAARLCDAENVVIYRTFGNMFRLAAGPVPANADFTRIVGANPQPIGLDTVVGRAHLEARPIQVADAVEYYRGANGSAAELARTSQVRTLLAVPLIRDGLVLGVISLARSTVRPFSAEAIDLVRTFADQAAIAIANVELFQTVERQRGELSRFLSPQVAALITSEQGAKMLDGHRRQITVAFCDLRGFTAFAETAEPEEVLGVLREYHRAMGELIVKHQGTLEHFAGDGMMVFFNDPLPVERHELQAVGMACAMRERFDELARAWQKRGYELGFGVGIATGYATLGRIGFEGRYDYGAVGNVVILAQRLSAEAKAGQILLSQRVQAAVEADAETTAVGEVVLKGFTRPVPAFAAVSLRTPAPARP
jgi:class 3 adenylate cyclase/FixJ family two-component response regulator